MQVTAECQNGHDKMDFAELKFNINTLDHSLAATDFHENESSAFVQSFFFRTFTKAKINNKIQTQNTCQLMSIECHCSVNKSCAPFAKQLSAKFCEYDESNM